LLLIAKESRVLLARDNRLLPGRIVTGGSGLHVVGPRNSNGLEALEGLA
jgi:hypothetical protein